MDEILKIDTIDRYNKLFGFETRHPLVGVVRFYLLYTSPSPRD